MNVHRSQPGEMENRLRGLRVADVMSRNVVTISEHDPLSIAAEEMFAKGISGAPVVDANGNCVGMISAVDFMRRQGAEGDAGPIAPPANEVVGHVMSRGAKSIAADAPLLDAARMMCEAHVHRLPVADADGRIAGILTSLDLVAALVNAEDETTG